MRKLTLTNIILLMTLFLFAQETTGEKVGHLPENSNCFSCHGSPTYVFFNEVLERNVTKRMNPYFLVDSVLYYDQNHSSFLCIDCHSYDYRTFPHDNDLQLDMMPSCLDCHEGDDETASFNFEEISHEFLESVHSTKHSEEFTCWMCHNPHFYKINARSNIIVKETIVYDNNICLSCHADINKYQLISPNKNPSVIEKHDWLPNQIAHFSSVRCIECHASSTEEALVAHHIETKDKAVKKCVECHSSNSNLMASLYKFKAQENRQKFGFFNAAILNDSYIIGANRNIYLNILSGVIFSIIIFLILIHTTLRIFLK